MNRLDHQVDRQAGEQEREEEKRWERDNNKRRERHQVKVCPVNYIIHPTESFPSVGDCFLLS